MDYEVIQINENTWRVENSGVRFFLLTGSKEALLIDSGMTIDNAKEIAESLTDLPLNLLNTHADMDHVAGNGKFETFYMHAAEASNYYHGRAVRENDFIPVEDGQIIDLGDRPLKIILIPGHTPGSVAILDINSRVLISGDSVQTGTIFMFGVQREIHAFSKSMKKLDGMRDQFDLVYPSHGEFPVDPDVIPKLYEASLQVMAGSLEKKEADFHGMKINLVDAGVASFFVE